MAEDPLPITAAIQIPLAEIEVAYSRSSGPGGQHVNKTETRVTLRFPVASSPSIPEDARALMVERLAPRLTKSGELLVSSEEFRERPRNLEAAYERLQGLLRRSLQRDKPRRPTRPSRGAKERRLNEKRQTAERKKSRRATDD